MTDSSCPTDRPRRRPRVEAPRSEVVRVRLSPQEAGVVRAAASRAGLSVGAWVGEAAVRQARAQARGEVDGAELSSWRDLVGALVALRAEVVGGGVVGGGVTAGDRVPVVHLGPALAETELLDGQPAAGHAGGEGDGVVGVVRRIDAATEAASQAASVAASRAGSPRRGGRGRPGRSS